jgi:rhodanese-related sulfurtransferase
MWMQALGIAAVITARGFAGFAAGGVLLGLGTAMVYPTLLAAIGDVAHPAWRASSVGVYRLWRDLGYAIGAVLAGLLADALGLPAAMWVVAAITVASGMIVAVRMTETLNPSPPADAMSTCIEPADLARIGATRTLAIVDVRSPQEYSSGHVDGAINIPLDLLADRSSELPRNALVVTVCGKGGGRSERAATELRARGFEQVRSLCGGTVAWRHWTARGARP